jgi:hypothetical protein
MLSHSHHPEMFTIVSMPTVSTPECVCDVENATYNSPNEKVRINWPDHTRWWDSYFAVEYNYRTYHCDANTCTISENGKTSNMKMYQLTEQIVSGQVSDMHIDRVFKYIDRDICVTLIVKRTGLGDLKVKIPGKSIWNFRF